MNKIVVDKIYERYSQEYKPLNTEEEKQELYAIANALAYNQMNHIFGLKPKHMHIYLQYIGVYTNGEPLNISQISRNVGLVENTVKKVIKKAQVTEKKYISRQLANIYAKNYYFNRIYLINCLELTEIETLMLYTIKINNIETIISNTKEEFFNKVMSISLNKFPNIDENVKKNLYRKIYNIVHELNLGFIDELEDTNPLKEYLNLNNLISNNHKLNDTINDNLFKLEVLKKLLYKFLYKYKNNILESISEISFYYPNININNMNQEEYKIFLETKIKELEKFIKEQEKTRTQNFALNEIYYDRQKEITSKVRKDNNRLIFQKK